MAADLEGVFDAAVVGAGPAGSATARRLALAGLAGCTAGTNTLRDTTYRRVVSSQCAGAVARTRPVVQVPGAGALALVGHLVAYGATQCSSRIRICSTLMVAAGMWTARPSTICSQTPPRTQALGSSKVWSYTPPCTGRDAGGCGRLPLDCRARHRTQTLCARVLIDATGRRAQVARALGAQRMLFDRLVGVAVHWAGVDATEQGHLLVEAAGEGWWYSAPLPSGRATQGRCDDRDAHDGRGFVRAAATHRC